MKNKIFFLIFIYMFCSVIPGCTDVFEHPASLSVVVNEMPQMENISCKFKQEKYMQNISRPFVSGGEFKFVENEGVYFHTTYPIESTVDYTNRDYKQINDVIKAISHKKYSKLENEFDFYYEKNQNMWNFGMKPKVSSKTANYISSIKLEGESYINKIIILLTNGNKTVLWFTK